MTTDSQHRQGTFRAYILPALIMLTCLRVWMGPFPIIETAQAQIPDAGLQRKLMVEEVRKTNRLLTEIKQLLTSHIFNVRIEGADNQADKSARKRGRGG